MFFAFLKRPSYLFLPLAANESGVSGFQAGRSRWAWAAKINRFSMIMRQTFNI
jgi:hypothetical protein